MRRDFRVLGPVRRWRRAVVVLLISSLVACGFGSDPTEEVPSPVCASGQIDGEVVLLSRDGQMAPEVIDRFERRYAVDVKELFYETDGEMLSRVTAGADPFDVVILRQDLAAILWRGGQLHALDPIALPGRVNLDTQLTRPDSDTEGFYTVPLVWGTVGIGLNVNVVPDTAETSWGLIFDLSQAWIYAGRVSLLDDPRQVMAAAMFYLGYSPNSANRDEVREAGRVVAEAKAHLRGFDSEDYAARLADGGLDLAQGRSDDFLAALAPASDDFLYVIPQEGAAIWLESMAVPVTSQHPCSAHSFIDYLLEPRTGALVADHIGEATANTASLSYLMPETAANRTLYPTLLARERLVLLEYTEELDLLYAEEFALVVE